VRLNARPPDERSSALDALLKLSATVDSFSNLIGKLIRWLVLGSVLISAGNAIIRKAFNISSNGFLEIQWYLFAGVFLLGSGFAFMRNVHVRIDFISSKLSKRTNTIIDILGIVVFIIPLCLMMVWLSWPLFSTALATGEMSQNAGGLIRWPAYLLMPLGFGLLLVQTLSELVKRIAFLKGLRDEPMSVEAVKSDEEILAEELAAQAAKKLAGA
jgi:TRAP-type mannitol/chloroaromatic compound transport system permease small subunit